MNFRNVCIALAVMAVFAGLAGAQLQQLAPVACTVSATTPYVASEGVTEKVSDILITCGTSATTATAGNVTRGTLLIDFGTAVTSRADATVANIGAASEILALINDPGAGAGPVAGYGQNAALILCSAANSYADQAAEIAGNTLAAANCPSKLIAKDNSAGTQTYWELDDGTGTTSAANAYQGAIGGSTSTITIGWTANQVKFFNIPVYPSFNSSQTNTIRIVNARVTPGSLAKVTATLTPTTLSLSNGSFVTGSVYSYTFSGSPVDVALATTGLTPSVTSIAGVSLCNATSLNPTSSQSKANLALVTFKEGAAGVFKTRVLPLVGTVAGEATGTDGLQTSPTGAYTITVGTNKLNLNAAASQSGLVVPALTVATKVAGLADLGTRLKAVFTNLDANTDYYVSLTPVLDYATPVTPPANPLSGAAFAPGDATQVGWAVLQAKGTATNGTAADESAAFSPATIDANANGGPAVAKLLKVKKTDGTYSAEAVWEVTNTVPGTAQTLSFALYSVYSVNNSTLAPAAGNNATIQLGFAPTKGTGVTAIPQFTAPGMAAAKFFNVLPCQTSLLFPFVSSAFGYETGIAISNTSADPYGTPTADGACNLNFYGKVYSGSTATAYVPPATAPSSGAIANGTTYAATLSSVVGTGFTGYGVATCNFQFAHGFAYILNPNGSAMGYLANVLNTANQTSVRGQVLLGENLGQ